jgi:hypothetical protein
MKRKIPYRTWSRECARFSNSPTATPGRGVIPSQTTFEHHHVEEGDDKDDWLN